MPACICSRPRCHTARQLYGITRDKRCLLLLYRFLEQLAGGKLCHFAGGNGNVVARAGIAPFAGGAVDNLEIAETGKVEGFSRGKGVFQGRDNGVQGVFRLNLGRQGGFGMEFIDKFSFGHGAFPLSVIGGVNSRRLSMFGSLGEAGVAVNNKI